MKLLIFVTAVVAYALFFPVTWGQETTIEGSVKSTNMEEQMSQMQANIERVKQQLEKSEPLLTRRSAN